MIDQSWISLIHKIQKPMDRNIIIATMIKQIIKNINLLLTHQFSYFLPLWKGKDFLLNKHIQFQSGKELFEGQYIGVDTQGCLMIQTKDQKIHALASGKITKID